MTSRKKLDNPWAVRYIRGLNGQSRARRTVTQRAKALTKKYGGNSYRWKDVRKYVLLLSNPQYYNDPEVTHGYMRGSETVNYVEKIMDRQSKYRHTKWR